MTQFLIALDQLFNTMLGGYADETLSARAWRNRDKNNWSKVIDAVFFWDKNHCEQSYNSELIRKHLPLGYRQNV